MTPYEQQLKMTAKMIDIAMGVPQTATPRYCPMCDHWFGKLRTKECPDCGADTERAK